MDVVRIAGNAITDWKVPQTTNNNDNCRISSEFIFRIMMERRGLCFGKDDDCGMWKKLYKDV